MVEKLCILNVIFLKVEDTKTDPLSSNNHANHNSSSDNSSVFSGDHNSSNTDLKNHHQKSSNIQVLVFAASLV